MIEIGFTMAECVQIKRVSIKHEAIMDFMIANPTVRAGDVAAHFGVTQAWLSTITHSDAFQDMLRAKQDCAFHTSVLPVKDKMMAIAHQALDRLEVLLPFETEATSVSKIAGDVLDRLGYGSKQVATQIINNTQNVQVNTLRNELQEAQQLLGQATVLRQLNNTNGVETVTTTVLEVEEYGARALVEVQREGATGVGEADKEPSVYTE